jgi:hypothetical protein
VMKSTVPETDSWDDDNLQEHSAVTTNITFP